MALADEIRDLADRVLRDLRAAHDLYEHTKSAWRVTQRFASEGHPHNIQDTETGTILSATDLDVVAERYITTHLAEAVFKDLASLLEDWGLRPARTLAL